MPALEERDRLFDLNQQRLEVFAYRALAKGLKPTDFVVVAIDVDDPFWAEFAEELMPGQNWQQFRDSGQKPIARGSVMADTLLGSLSEIVPAIAEALRMDLPKNMVRAIVMGDGGASVYFVRPASEFKGN